MLLNNNHKIINYKSSFFESLKSSYENSFNKKFISRFVYENRFGYKDKYSSYLLISAVDESVIGHIGFRIHNLNSKLKYKIAFRFSTFIVPRLRGSGIYLEFMNYVKNDLNAKFNVHFIYAWPNKINLLSCLKDKDYINLNPIITWQHKLGDTEIICEKKEMFTYKSLDFLNFEHTIITNEFGLTLDTKESYKSVFLSRENKEYKILAINKNRYAILGISYIDNKEFISIIINNDLEIGFILNVLKRYFKSNNIFVQCWCFHKDKNLLRQLIKLDFKQNGPVFYNGIYELTKVKFTINEYFPYMYNHDAF